jgi:hypothetical protein
MKSTGRHRGESTDSEVGGRIVPKIPRDRHTAQASIQRSVEDPSKKKRRLNDSRLDVGVLLMLKGKHGLVKQDSLVLLGEHFHQRLHEVLSGRDDPEHTSSASSFKLDLAINEKTHPDLVPNIIITLKSRQRMLQRNDEAVSFDKLLGLGTS